MTSIINYIRDTRAEMAFVKWPTRKQAIIYAVLVVLVSLGVASLLGISDFVFSRLLTLVLK